MWKKGEVMIQVLLAVNALAATTNTTTPPTATTTTPTTTTTSPTTTTTTPTTTTTSPTTTTTTPTTTTTTPTTTTTTPTTTTTTPTTTSNMTTLGENGDMTTESMSKTTIDPQRTVSAVIGAHSTDYMCASGTPDNWTDVRCPGGCFGLLANNETPTFGCANELELQKYGFGEITKCGVDEKEGQCVNIADEENCMRCCTDKERCNRLYLTKCDYRKDDPACSGCDTAVISLAVSPLALLLIHFINY